MASFRSEIPAGALAGSKTPDRAGASAADLEIEPLELLHAINTERGSIFLLDVRQPEEFSRVSIEGSVLVPMMELPSRLEEIRAKLDQSNQTVVICRSGQRSMMVTEWLQAIGYSQARNLRGGINAYAREADPSLEPY